MKIMLVGAGGIGGYLTAKLCLQYAADITLIARGAQLQAIREKGLTLIEPGATNTVYPSMCTDKPEEAGIQDAIFFCTKSYGLKQALLQVAPCVGAHTLLIPLLNGISARNLIKEHLKAGIAMSGCIYIFSQIVEPGVIKQTGDVRRVCMGLSKSEGKAPEALYTLRDMLLNADVQAEIPADMDLVMWDKWLLMLSNAQAAAYFNVPIGQLRDSKEKYAFAMKLLDEALLVAQAEHVNLPPNTKAHIEETIASLAYESVPSMARDLNVPGKPTELSMFAGELCRRAALYGIDVPYNQTMLSKFADRL